MTFPWTGNLLIGLIFALSLKITIAEIEFTVSPRSQTILYGDDVILNCKAEDTTNPTQDHVYSWYLNAGPRPQGTSVYLNNSLLIQNIQKVHLGNYTCVVMDSTGVVVLAESSPALIIHAYIRNFVIHPDPAAVMEGETISLECVTGESSPPPEIFWERNNKIFTSGSQYNATYKSYSPSGIIRQMSMKLVMVAKPSDSGMFSCVSSNSMLDIRVRSLEVLINITAIRTRPHVDPLLYKRNVLSARDMPLLLPCPIVGFPVPVISWKKENIPISDTEDYFIMANGSLYFKSLRIEDEGYYICEGNNALGMEESPDIILQAAYIEMDFRMDPYSIYAIAGQPITLPCSPPISYPPANVTWYKNDQLMTFDQDNKTFIVSPAFGVWDLFFADIQKRDAGQYFCVATNSFAVPSSRTSKFATINVGGAPTFVEPPLSQTVVLGGGLKLKCVVDGDPIPRISWLLNRIPIDEGQQVSISSNGQELHVSKINKAWEGIYTCRAANTYGISESNAVIEIIAPPTIVQPISNQSVTSGNDVILMCEVQGDPKPIITWYKDNQTLTLLPHYKLTDKDLTIHNVSYSDSGLYSCQATNDGGSVRSEGYLTVNVMPYFTKWPLDSNVIIGGSLNLLCEVKGHPIPVTRWLYNGTNLFPAGVFISPEHHLTVSMVTWQHVGTYTCVGANNVGTSSKSAKLSLLIPPAVLSIVGDSVVFLNTNTELSCTVYGIPTPTMQWYRHGNPVTSSSDGRIVLREDNSLIVKFARLSDAGEYKCVSVNIAGKTEKSAMVFVIGPPVPPLLLDPVSLSATSIKVRWIPSSQKAYTPVSHYVIYYREKTDTNDIRYPNIVNSTELSADILSLSPGTEYFFSVSSVNQAGEGQKSNIKSEKTFDSGPTEPRNLQVTGVNSTAVTLRWEIPENTNGQIRKYKIVYKKQNTNTVPVSIVMPSERITASVSHTISGLQPFSDYEFFVQAATIEQDVDLWGVKSNVIAIKTGVSAPTGSPQNVQTTVLSAHQVKVTWQAVPILQQHGPIKFYHVKYTMSGDTQLLDKINVSVSQSSITVTNLLPWRQYSFVVEAENDGGIGPGSIPVVAKTPAAAPSGSPQDIRLQSVSQNVIMVHYKFPDRNTWNSDLSGVIIEVQLVSDNSTNVLKHRNIQATSYNISNLKPWTFYRVRVALFTDQVSAGQGPFSNWFVTQTLESEPGPVIGISYQVTPTSIMFTWLPPQQPNGIILGYEVLYYRTEIGGNPGDDLGVTTTAQDSTTVETKEPDIVENQQRTKREVEKANNILTLPDSLNINDVSGLNSVCKHLQVGNSNTVNLLDEILLNVTAAMTTKGETASQTILERKQDVLEWTMVNLKNGQISKSENERTILTGISQVLINMDIGILQWIVLQNSSIGVICDHLQLTRTTTNGTMVILETLLPSTTYKILLSAYTSVGMGNISLLTLKTGDLPPPPPSPSTTSTTMVQTTINSLRSSKGTTDNLPAILAGCAAGVLLILFILVLIMCVCIKRRQSLNRALYDEKNQDGIFGDIPQDGTLGAQRKDGATGETTENGTRFSTGRIDIVGADTVKYGTNSTTSRQAHEYRFMKESQSMPASVNYNLNGTSDRQSNISGIENPGYLHQAEKDSESIAVSLTLSAEEVYSQASNTLNRKSRMRSESAAAIAVMRNTSMNIPTGLTVDDTESLINNDTVVVYAERTAL